MMSNRMRHSDIFVNERVFLRILRQWRVSKMTIRGEKVCGTPAPLGPPAPPLPAPLKENTAKWSRDLDSASESFPVQLITQSSLHKHNKFTRGILLTRWNLSKTERRELWKRLLKMALGLISDLPFITAEEQGPIHDTDFIRWFD